MAVALWYTQYNNCKISNVILNSNDINLTATILTPIHWSTDYYVSVISRGGGLYVIYTPRTAGPEAV